jgi:transposase
MPTSHAAVRHGVSWDKARRAEKAFLAQWDRTRVKRQPRLIGLDEIQRGKGQRFWTVLSDVVHGEVIGLRHDRSEGAATALLTEDLTGRQRGAIAAVCTDMHRALSQCSQRRATEGGGRCRQISCAPARECGAR